MMELNCSNVESTINSTAKILAVDASKLRFLLVATDLNELLAGKPFAMPESVVWFHATRIPRATDFQDGLLPGPIMRPRLLQSLQQLAIKNGLSTVSEWEALAMNLSSPELSWKHSLPQMDDGPHGFLVRETILDRGDVPIPDYTDTPEYVRNLCGAFPGDMGGRLLEGYRAYSSRAIVSFRSSIHLTGVMKCALSYARAKL